MPPIHRNGRLEIRLDDEGCQALANIYPPSGKDGQAIEYDEVIDKLKKMSVTYGFRDQAIRDALRQAAVKSEVAYNVIVAQGVPPQPGQDAKIRYHLPVEDLMMPVPRRRDGSGLVDWFALEERNMVKAEQQLATLIPAQPGVPGRTLTYPVQPIMPRNGRPAALSAGQNVRYSEDGLHLCAMHDGHVSLHGEQLVVHAFRKVTESAVSEILHFPAGAVFYEDVFNTEAQAGEFIGVRGNAGGSFLRARGDVLVHSAEDCRIVATGNVYVAEGLRNCDVTTGGKILLLGSASVTGGVLRGREGIEAGSLGSEEMEETQIEAGKNAYALHRIQEIGEEITACEANIARIIQSLKPFITIAMQSSLTDEKRALVSRLQAQRRSQELTMKELHCEKRQSTIAAKEIIPASVTVRDTTYPGVWLRIGTAEILIESPIEAARFIGAANGRTINAVSLRMAA